jgi:putative ABC transport system substrate-binding protein
MITVAVLVVAVLLCLTGLIFPGVAGAQRSRAVPTIGVLIVPSVANANSYVRGLESGLQELGYIEGETIVIERRYADGQVDRLPGLAAELARLNPQVLFAGGDQAIRALRNAPDRRAPIVMVACDAVASGFVTNLARPGGDITGVTCITAEVSAKRLEIMRELVPGLERIGLLVNPKDPGKVNELKQVEAAARQLRLSTEVIHLNTSDDIREVLTRAAQRRLTTIVHLFDSGVFAKRAEVAAVALESGLAMMFSFKQFVEAGGLISFGPSLPAMWHRAASHVDKILKGAKPGDLPVEQPTRFELAINLKSARALGVTIPPQLLLRADAVIK